jgi:hypothetical protein
MGKQKSGHVRNRKNRDYAAEYDRRIARALANGLSRSQARGHPKSTEIFVRSRQSAASLDDERLQRALRILRQDKNLGVAAKSIGISPERLKHAGVSKGAIRKDGGRWVLNPELPRRMLIFSRGRALPITVGDQASASLVGQYMSAVAKFLTTNSRALLSPFAGKSVADISGKRHPFETNPNTLYRLTSSGGDSFEQVYRIVI